MTTKRMLIPCESYEIGKLEQWLSDMAGEGYVLCKDSLHTWYAVFEVMEPVTLFYRIESYQTDAEVFPDEDHDPEWDQKHINDNEGWKYISKYNNYQVFFRKEKGRNVSDSEVKEGLCKQALFKNGILLGIGILSVITSIYMLMYTAVTLFRTFSVVWMVVSISTAILMVIKIVHIVSVLRSSDTSADRDWKKKRYLTLNRAMTLAMIICMLCGMVMSSQVLDNTNTVKQYNMISAADPGELPEGVSEEMYILASNTSYTINAYADGEIQIIDAYKRMAEIYNGVMILDLDYTKDKELRSEIDITFQKFQEIESRGIRKQIDIEVLKGYQEVLEALL